MMLKEVRTYACGELYDEKTSHGMSNIDHSI
jgi:hypothetical protein